MIKKFKIKNIVYLILLSFFVVSFLINNTNKILAQEKSSDAIAIRIIANPKHYSAMRWYREQNFQGSPQSLLVDGYSAVRDGRTVYVNVANINDPNLWTNIYFISYNQKAESVTVDIFGQILNHWKFNDNITPANTDLCKENDSIFCTHDDECPIGDYCYSKKARIIRDVKRLENLSEINIKLNEYYNLKEHYPILGAGTYLPNKSLSVWPSWKEEFSNEIGMSLPVDPINKIGECPGYDEITCWNEDQKEFATNLPTMLDNSIIYWYITNFNGSSYEICSVLESGFDIQGDNLISLACDGVCIDGDFDGYGLYFTGDPGLCSNPEVDCDDNNSLIGAGTAEICSGGVDEDCDTLVDCDDDDCNGDPNCSMETCNYDCICQPDLNETCSSCPEDFCCGTNPCGNGICDDTCECSYDSCPCPVDCFCGNNSTDCGEECDDGNNNNGDGCSFDCHIEGSSCVDNDNDGYDNCNIGDFGDDGNVIDCHDSPAVCGANCYPNNPSEICDGFDNDCDGEIDEGFNDDNCGLICETNGHDYNESRGGDLRCCGDDANEGSYQSPEIICNDGRDNDCDGTFDDSALNLINPDTDCLACNSGNNTGEHFWYVANQSDCNQCDNEGSQDDDQFLENWSLYPGMADQCDSDCGIVSVTVSINSYEVTELTCDGIDNDCDGEIDEDNVCVVCTDDDNDNYSAEGGGSCCGVGNNLPCNAEIDCDDERDYVNPGEIETCDTHDNDCDGDTDEGCDDDGDGYCDDNMQLYNNNSMCFLTVFTGNSMYGDDCDDDFVTGAFSNPGITNETVNTNCNDTYDNDCDGNPDCADTVDCSTDPFCVTGNSPSLSLNPASINVSINNNFNLNLQINTDGENVVVARAIVNYDTDNFSLESYDISNTVFASNACVGLGMIACEIIDNNTANGTISITLAKPSPGVNDSSGLFAVLTFRALQEVTDDITIDFIGVGNYTDSDIILDDGNGTDILNSVTNSTITVTNTSTGNSCEFPFIFPCDF